MPKPTDPIVPSHTIMRYQERFDPAGAMSYNEVMDDLVNIVRTGQPFGVKHRDNWHLLAKTKGGQDVVVAMVNHEESNRPLIRTVLTLEQGMANQQMRLGAGVRHGMIGRPRRRRPR